MHPRDLRGCDQLKLVLGDHRAGVLVHRDDDQAVVRVHDLGGDVSPHELIEAVLAPRLIGEILNPDAILGAAVIVVDDDVLRDVDETPRQVARVGGTDGRICQTLACAVGRQEVLED